jgi:hypothetical protein
MTDATLREELVSAALRWEKTFGNAPAITSVISEYDAAQLVKCSDEEYSTCMKGITAVQKGHDFLFDGNRYQVKGNRPSGKAGSFVTIVAKARNYDWDFLIWILYDKNYVIQEAWQWDVESYRVGFDQLTRLSPNHMRQGVKLISVR